jgi:hypothetical protein
MKAAIVFRLALVNAGKADGWVLAGWQWSLVPVP